MATPSTRNQYSNIRLYRPNMNINCIICSDLFLPNSEIFATKCGHIFHHVCLVQWIERSKTCPQCRAKTTDKNIYRIYFNILSAEGIEEDAVSLQNKVDSLNLALRLKENFVRTTEEEIERVNGEKKCLENKLSNMKSDYEKYKSGNASLKEQIRMYQEQVKIVDLVQKENKQLKEKMRALKVESTALKGSYEEAQAVINNCDSIQTLSMISTSMKKELISMERKRNHVLSKLRQTENELNNTRKDCEQFKKEIDRLEYELKAHRQCEAEMTHLRAEISKLIESKNEPINPSLVRVVTESPAPMLTKLKQNRDLSFEKNNSPSVSKRVEDIKDSDSPYLTVKSNCLSMFLKNEDISMRFKDSLGSSIFKKTGSSSLASSKRAIPEGSYNGFGGHAKEDRYPTPKLTGLKRSKSATVTSKKLKKTETPNTKLDDFFNISDLDHL